MIHQIKKYGSLVVFAHTVFALPFALIGFTLAYYALHFDCVGAPGYFPIRLLQVLVCMVTARNCAMGFNRYVDRFIDAQNERTQKRELPSGRLSPKAVVIFLVVNVLIFLGCCFTISRLCFYLAFPTLFILCGYSYTKRFTWLCHFVLGLALAIAPAGAYLSVTGTLTPPVWWLSLMVVLWVGGFDILYALPDEDFDQEHRLHSIPQRFGRKWALLLSGGVHLCVLPLMVLFGNSLDKAGFASTGWAYWVAVVMFTGLLIYQHAIVGVHNISKLNRAFFTTNGVASALFAVLTIASML